MLSFQFKTKGQFEVLQEVEAENYEQAIEKAKNNEGNAIEVIATSELEIDNVYREDEDEESKKQDGSVEAPKEEDGKEKTDEDGEEKTDDEGSDKQGEQEGSEQGEGSADEAGKDEEAKDGDQSA